MDDIIELILEILIEGSIEISKNKKVSKWIRYPLIALIILLFSIVIIGLFIIGIMLLNENIYASLLMIVISIVLLVFSIIKFKKIYLNNNIEKDKENKYV